MQNKKEKLNGKDFINIGIFTAIYMVIVIVIACTVGLIPIGFILLPIILPIIGGIPMMLYFTKVKKAGMLLIFEILFGLVMILTGMGYDLLIWGVKTLKLDIPLVPENRINWAFVPLHIAKNYILKLYLDEEIIPRCRFPCSRGYHNKYINWQKKQ